MTKGKGKKGCREIKGWEMEMFSASSGGDDAVVVTSKTGQKRRG